MITVNLLPPELRPVEHTPLPRLLVIYTGVALAAIGLTLLVFMHFSWIPDIQTKIDNKTQEVESLKQQAAEYETLNLALQNITQRENACEEIWRTRTLWWHKLDLLCDLAPAYVGLTTFTFKEPTAARGQLTDGGTLRMDCIAAKEEEKRVASFRRILKGELPPDWGTEGDKDLGRQFIGAFVNGEILDYGWKMVELPDYPDQPAIQFALEMKLKRKEDPQVTETTVPGAARQPGVTR